MISDHLRAIPKLDKQSFISTYVQTQKAFAKEHSIEGHSFATLWTNDNKPKPTTTLPHDVNVAGYEEYRDYGFNTPVLKPRKTQKSNMVQTESKELKKAIRETKQTQNPVNITIANAKSNKSRTRQSHLPPSKSTQKLKPSQKRAITSELDANEHIDRLAERRERKRVKRDIIKPKEIVDVADKVGPDDENKKQKGKRSKSNVALGFALIHGFTASNVGKKRLTMQPPLQTAGVFGKGKASAKTATVKKSLKKGRYNDGFSEMKFLNSFPTKGRKRSFQDSIESISNASSHSSSSSVYYPPLSPKQQVSPIHKRHTKKRPDKENESISSRSPQETKRKRFNPDSELHITTASSDRTGSILWDIEKEDFEFPPTALSERRQETVILSARNLRWTHKDSRVSNAHENLTRTLLSAGGQKSFDEKSSISSSSISPSQSASQCPNPVLPRPSMIACDSKYFQPSVPDTAKVDIDPQIRHVSGPEIVDEGDNKDHSRFPETLKEGELLVVSTVSDPKNCFLPSNSETRPDIQKTAILTASVVAPPNSMGESHTCSHDIDSAGQDAHIHHFSNVHIPIIPHKSRPNSVLQEQLFSAVHRDLPHNAFHIPKTVSSGQAEWLEFDQFRPAWGSDPQLNVDCFDEYRTYGNDIDSSSNLGFEDYTYTAEEIYASDVVQLDEDLHRYPDFGSYDLGITPTNGHPDHRVLLDHLDEYGNFDPVEFSGLSNSQNHESYDMSEMEETYGHRQLPFSTELPYIFYRLPSPSSTFQNMNYVECDDLESTHEDNTDIMSVSSYDSFEDSVGPDKDSEIHHLSALRFLQGKELLHGYAEMQQNQLQTHQQTRISTTEADVAKTLKHHWLPQKF